MTQRYSFIQCGNCIDIYDTRTGRMVAMLNLCNRDAQDVFTEWQALRHEKIAGPIGIALACACSLVAWYFLIYALTGSN